MVTFKGAHHYRDKTQKYVTVPCYSTQDMTSKDAGSYFSQPHKHTLKF